MNIKTYERLQKLRWSKTGQLLHYPISNKHYHLGWLDWDDWLDWWMWGAPVRLYGPMFTRRDWWIDFPGTNRRMDKIWADAEPRQVTRAPHCSLCDEDFESRRDLGEHYKQVHPSED